jgi:hypothetical protein
MASFGDGADPLSSTDFVQRRVASSQARDDHVGRGTGI